MVESTKNSNSLDENGISRNSKTKTPFYKLQSLSRSASALGDRINEIPSESIKRVSSSKSLFSSIFKAELVDEKEKSSIRRKFTKTQPLKKSFSFFFGSKSSPDEEEVLDHRFKPLDFENHQTATTEIRNWDSLTADELESVILRPNRKSVVQRGRPLLQEEVRRHSEARNYKNQVPISGNPPNEPLVLHIPKRRSSLPKIHISQLTESENATTTLLDSNTDNNKLPEIEELSRAINSTLDRNPDKKRITQRRETSPIPSLKMPVVSPPKFWSFNRPIKTFDDLKDTKKFIMNQDKQNFMDIAISVIQEEIQDLEQKKLPQYYSLQRRKKSSPDLSPVDEKSLNFDFQYQFETVATLTRRTSPRMKYIESHRNISADELPEEDEILDLSESEITKEVAAELPAEKIPIKTVEKSPVLIFFGDSDDDSDEEGGISDEEGDETPSLNTKKESSVGNLSEKKSYNDVSAHLGSPNQFHPIDVKLNRSGSSKSNNKSPWSWLASLIPKRGDRNAAFYPTIEVAPGHLHPEKEKEVYGLSHIKLAEVERSLLEQILISNFMLYILKINANVTLQGRGPQRKKRKNRARRRRPIIEAMNIPDIEDEANFNHRIPAEPLLKFDEPIVLPKLDDEDDEDDIPLAMLKKK